MNDALALAGVDARPWMRLAGLPDINAMKSAPWRSVADLDTMMRVTRQAAGDPGFGLVVAAVMVQSHRGALAPLSMHAPTLRAALDDICHYTRLLQVSNELSYAVGGAHCIIRFAPLGTSAEGQRSRAEQIMGGMLMLLRYYGVRRAGVHHIHFTHHRPDYGARYAGLFGASVQFAREACEIAIDATAMDIVHPARDAGFYAMAKARAQMQLAAIERCASTGAIVRRLLVDRDHEEGLPTMLGAAENLGISERTLRRRLASEGLSYGQLLAESRRRTVESLLMRGDTPLKQIATTLGYASISSFHRAFRQKTGLTPLQWKRQQVNRAP